MAIRLSLARLKDRGFRTMQIEKLIPDAIAIGKLWDIPELFAIECLPQMSDMVRTKASLYRDKGYDSTIFVFYASNPLRIAYPKHYGSTSFTDLIHESLTG